MGNRRKGSRGAVARVLDLAKAFERVCLPVVWACATHFSFPRKVLRVLCGYFEHQRRVQFERCVAEPLWTFHGHLARVKVELPAFAYCTSRCAERGHTNYSSVEVEGICGCHHSTPKRKKKNREVAEMAKKVLKKLKEEIEKKGLKIVSHRKWEGRENQDDCVMWLPGR